MNTELDKFIKNLIVRLADQKAVKKLKIQEWLKSHDAFDETLHGVKDGFVIRIIENTGYLFKEISKISLND